MHNGPLTRSQLKQRQDATARLKNVLLGVSSETIERVLTDKPDLSAPIIDGHPPLAYAIKVRNNEWAEALLRAGAENTPYIDLQSGQYVWPSEAGFVGWSIRLSETKKPIPILDAILAKNYTKVKQLIALGEEINVKMPFGGRSQIFPLEYSVEQNDFELTKILLDAGADINVIDYKLTGIMSLSGIKPNIFELLAKKVDQQEESLLSTAYKLLEAIKLHCAKADSHNKKPIILLGESHWHTSLHAIERIIISYLREMNVVDKAYIEIGHNRSSFRKWYMLTAFGLAELDMECIDKETQGNGAGLVGEEISRWLDERDRFMADKINKANHSAIHLVGCSHLEGVTKYIDSTRYSVLPINLKPILLSLMCENTRKIYKVNRDGLIKKFKCNHGIEFAHSEKDVLQAEYVPHTPNRKRKRDKEDIVFSTEEHIATRPRVIVPAYSKQRKSINYNLYHLRNAACTAFDWTVKPVLKCFGYKF